MQYWFYSAEVYEDAKLINRISGTYPDEDLAQSLSIIINFDNPKEVMNSLIGMLSELNNNRVVHFLAFNRV